MKRREMEEVWRCKEEELRKYGDEGKRNKGSFQMKGSGMEEVWR